MCSKIYTTNFKYRIELESDSIYIHFYLTFCERYLDRHLLSLALTRRNPGNSHPGMGPARWPDAHKRPHEAMHIMAVSLPSLGHTTSVPAKVRTYWTVLLYEYTGAVGTQRQHALPGQAGRAIPLLPPVLSKRLVDSRICHSGLGSGPEVAVSNATEEEIKTDKTT